MAHMSNPSYDGRITYDESIDGNPVTGHGHSGVEVFASGLRSPFGLLLHSNGKLYATGKWNTKIESIHLIGHPIKTMGPT